MGTSTNADRAARCALAILLGFLGGCRARSGAMLRTAHHGQPAIATPDDRNEPSLSGLFRANGATPVTYVVECLETVRRDGVLDGDDAARLASLAEARSPLFQGRDRSEVPRLRAYVILTLTDVGQAQAALPAVRDVLFHPDQRSSALELGAGLRAVASLGQAGSSLLPEVLDALSCTQSDLEIGLGRLVLDFGPGEATTVKLEAIEALVRITAAADLGEVSSVLEPLGRPAAGADPRVAEAAQRAVLAIAASASGDARVQGVSLPDLSRPGRSDWIPPEDRSALPGPIAFVDQDGATGDLATLLDRPTAMAFFYTRCQNAYKCTATVQRLGELQAGLRERRLGERIRLLAVSYEPRFDTPERIRRFAGSRGMVFDDCTRALVLPVDSHGRLTKDLEVAVSYNDGWVNLHGVELFLFDASGRLVRRYHTIGWDNDEVLDDLARLLREPTRAADG